MSDSQNPAQRIELQPSPAPIAHPVTKFGGQPVWIAGPQWPISRSTKKPMRFICQAALPDGFRAGGQQMAYVFMTDGEDYVEGTWEPEGGENCVILRPGPFEPITETEALGSGPTLQKAVDDPESRRRIFQDVELAVQLTPASPETEDDGPMTRWLGAPKWLQGDDTPAGGMWKFLMQIDSCSDHYEVNFGDAGVAYVFVSEDGKQARFLWQCC